MSEESKINEEIEEEQEETVKNGWSNKKAGKSYRVTQTKCLLPVTLNGNLTYVFALQNYEGILMFDSGKLVLVNFLKQLVIKVFDVDKEIKLAKLYDNDSIVFISRSTKQLKLFTFRTPNIILTVNVRAMADYQPKIEEARPRENINVHVFAQLPTVTAMPINERTEYNMDCLFREGMDLIVLPKTNYVVLLEMRMSYSGSQNECICSVFHRSKPEMINQVIYNENSSRMYFLALLDMSSTICLYHQQFESVRIYFMVWDVSNTTNGSPFKNFKLKASIDGCIQSIAPFGENKAAVVLNLSKGMYPILKIFDFTKDSEVEEQTIILDVLPLHKGIRSKLQDDASQFWNNYGQISSRSFAIQDLYLVDESKQMIVWQRFGEGGQYLDIYSHDLAKVTFSQCESEDDDTSINGYSDIGYSTTQSIDNRYLISYNWSQLDYMTNQDRPQQFQNQQQQQQQHQQFPQQLQQPQMNLQLIPFKISTIFNIKYSLIHLMTVNQLFQHYGEEVCKNILDMILGNPQEEEDQLESLSQSQKQSQQQ